MKTGGDNFWIRAIAVAAVVLVFIPYVWGYLHEPPGMAFMGFADHPYDQNSYLSRIQQASEGKFFIRRDFTLEYQRPLFFNPFTWTLGVIVRLSGLSPLAVYYGAIAGYAFLLFYVIHWFISIFIRDRREATFAFSLCAFSSGLCWLISFRQWEILFQRHNIIPIDYWVAETIMFETIFSFPQFALTSILMLLTFGFSIKSADGRFLSRSLWGGAALFALCFVHTVDVVTVGVVLAAYGLAAVLKFRPDARRVVASCALIAAVALPGFLYMRYLFTAEPVFIEWSKEKFLSPHPLSYIIGYGLVLFLAIPEVVRILRKGGRGEWLLAVWVIAVAVLLYLPVSFQRRLSTAVHVPLCILAARAVFRHLLPRLRAAEGAGRIARENLVLIAIVLATIPGNFAKIANCIREMRGNPLEFYLYRGDLEAMAWMMKHRNEDAAILSAYKSGLYLPAYTGNRVYVGHWSETLKFNEKARLADWVLYGAGEEDAKRAFLRSSGIRYIYFGNFERMRGPFALAGASFLTMIYDAGGVRIYELKNS